MRPSAALSMATYVAASRSAAAWADRRLAQLNLKPQPRRARWFDRLVSLFA